jgi:hypothetical protein
MQASSRKLFSAEMVPGLALLFCASVVASETAAATLARQAEGAGGAHIPSNKQGIVTSDNLGGTADAADRGSSGVSQFAAAGQPSQCGTGYWALGKLCGEPAVNCRVFESGLNNARQQHKQRQQALLSKCAILRPALPQVQIVRSGPRLSCSAA